MKNNLWAKTTLSVYRYLERICDAIDKMVENKAMASFYVCSCNLANSNIINVADKIIALSERKKTLINLKVLVDNALKNCEHINAQILIEHYMDNDKVADIVARHNFSERSYFRKMENAEKDFLTQLALQGFSESHLAQYLANEKWILDVYSRFLNQEKNLPVISEARINRLVFSNS